MSLRDALELAECGIEVFALAPHSKTPPKGSRGHLGATMVPEEIERLFAAAGPDANIGIRPADGTWILDVDSRHGGIETMQRLTREHGELPQTVTAKTPTGGWHLYWSGDARQSQAILPGIDTRNRGGYVVAPPSVHPSGGRYRWARAPWDVPISPAPPWLSDLVARRPAAPAAPRPAPAGYTTTDRIIDRAIAYVDAMPEAISGSGGHQALWDVAVALVRGFALSPALARTIILSRYNERCQPPWSEREIEHKIADAVHARDVGMGYLLDRSGRAA